MPEKRYLIRNRLILRETAEKRAYHIKKSYFLSSTPFGVLFLWRRTQKKRQVERLLL